MANVNGINITLPDGTEFHGRGNLSIQIEHQADWLLAGGGSVLGYVKGAFNDLVGTEAIHTPLATGYIGNGGTRTFEIAFDQWEGNTDTWGPANADDPADEKLAILENEISRAGVSSIDPATLEFGPYSSTSSRYDPIPVVFPQISPSVDFADGPSTFRSRITCAEAIDLSKPIDEIISEDFRLTPAGSSTPRIPIPADTLGPQGRGSGMQRQGRETVPSGLVDVNNDTASPTTKGTKVLPAEVRLRGAWRGDGAAGIADTFKTEFLANDAVEKVELTAPSRTRPTPLTGTYVLDQQSYIDPLTPQIDDGVYGFEMVLSEK